MTTKDGIGRPRPPETVERDDKVLAAVVELGSENGVRTANLRTKTGLDKMPLVHSLNRLRRSGKVDRRDGYRWWPSDS
jgi:hypothetical protein